ncbi:MAG TPA: TIGR03936 family radical SAM-associated protein [Mycobacteriales bacterium]|nr:TIGR03936 family radical SAM-associated protein [Mycobacteriales bacterium]
MSPKRQPDNPVDVIEQRVRIRYAKRGRLRFASHRDFARALERSLRRAQIPIAHSAGFTPHPKVSYVGAAPTGAASEAEYAELALTRRVDPDQLRVRLDAALPPGLDITECVETHTGALADQITASEWRVELPGIAPERLQQAVERFLQADEVLIERVVKSGRRLVDARAAVASVQVRTGASDELAGDGCAILDVVVRHVTPAVRPDDVLAALRLVADLVPPVPARATRLAQGQLGDDGRLADPLALDRAAADSSGTPASEAS